jgi:pSer/pThr/pTyr-binding forkhead associated (FHA) protein
MISSTEPLNFPPALFRQSQVSLEALKKTGLPLSETTYLTIGGGIGSFTWVDHLVIAGVDPAKIVAIGLESKPYARFRRLCRNSQIFEQERLRSDSGATPDNIWGWPGYALREMWQALKRGDWRHTAYLTWQIFTEPVLCEPFTPTAAALFAAIDRETRRIGWEKIWQFGQAQAIRKTDDGRYVVAYLQTPLHPQRCRLIIAPYLHLSLGYPQPRFLPDLQSYRQQTGDCKRFVHAYEPHDHLYNHLRQYGGTVLLRGRGIVASRILERLYEERCHNLNINILHLMRQPKPEGPKFKDTRRLTKNHFDHQSFNFPKSCFGGHFRFTMEQANSRQRAELIELWGSTTTAKRQPWENIINTGLNQGWYQIRFGEVTRVEPSNGHLATVIAGSPTLSEQIELQTDFIIDATGLDSAPESHPILQDLLQTYQLPQNHKGQLQVTNQFEIAGLRHKGGRVYASGIMTLGGPFAPVDSFTGLQYAALCALESLVAAGALDLRPLHPLRSLVQWLRWARGVKP